MKCITGQPLTRLDIGKLRTAQATHSADCCCVAAVSSVCKCDARNAGGGGGDGISYA